MHLHYQSLHKKGGRGGTRTLDLTDVNRFPFFPYQPPHGHLFLGIRATFGRSSRAPFGLLNSYTICINTIYCLYDSITTISLAHFLHLLVKDTSFEGCTFVY